MADKRIKEEAAHAGYKPSTVAHDVFLHETLLSRANLAGTSEQQLLEAVLEFRRDRLEIPKDDFPIVKYCTYYKELLHINEFAARKNEKGGLSFSSLSLKGDNERSKLRVKSFNDINYPLMRLWFNGDENEKLKCLVTGKILEDITEMNESIGQLRTYNLFQLHHILTILGLSVHKIDVDIQPSYLLGKRDLTLPENKADLVDLMNTVCICPDEHDKVHCSSRQSDLGYWDARNARPWGLKSEDNFRYFCNKLPHLATLNYQKFENAQKIEWYKQREDTIDLKKNPQDKQLYLTRFE